MTQFDFDIGGTCGPCCAANVPAFIDKHTLINHLFTITDAELSPDYQRLIIQVAEEDENLEDAVESYLMTALAPSNKYTLIPKKRSDRQSVSEQASIPLKSESQNALFWYWIFAALGLGSGMAILTLCLAFGALSLPMSWGIAAVSIPLTLLLGKDSFLTVKMDFENRQPGMDSLFAVSTLTALSVSVFALFMPGLPMMFDVGLLIFGFRHLGIAIKKSMYAAQNANTQYHHLVSAKTFTKKVGSIYQKISYDTLRPGDILSIAVGEMIPVNGWLCPADESSETEYELDVYLIEGSNLPRSFAKDEAVYAGMVAKKPCLMRVGFSQTLNFFDALPDKGCDRDKLQVYLNDLRQIKVITPSQTHVTLSDRDLTNMYGKNLSPEITTALGLKTLHQLSAAPLRQQLSLGILNHAAESGLTQTASSLKQINDELKQSALTKAPVQKEADKIYRIFVPLVIGITIISGVMLAFFFPAMIVLRCMISILVSACPCTLGFIMPLVMELARQKAQKEHIVFHDSEAIEHLAKVNKIAMDLHRTLTLGKPKVYFEYHQDSESAPIETDEVFRQRMNTYIALLEQSSSHFIGMTIYAAIKGDELLEQFGKGLDVRQLQQLPEGISAVIDNERYLLGNNQLMARYNRVLPSGATYLMVEKLTGFQLLATITVQDTLRADARSAIDYCQSRLGIEVAVITGGDAATAEHFAPKLHLNNNHFYFGRTGGVAGDNGNNFTEELSKEALILKFRENGQYVLMVGDGPNDLRALQQAHVGMVMSYPLDEYSDLQPKSHARILNGEVMAMVKAIEIAKQAMVSVKQNLWFSLVYNLLAVLLTLILLLCFGMVLHPGIGAALMVVQTCVIIFNTYRLHLQSLPSSETPKVQDGLTNAAVLKKQGLFLEPVMHVAEPTGLRLKSDAELKYAI